MKMDQKAITTLLELAAKSLLSHEFAALHALEELPRDVFVPLFISAFLGRHKKILKEMMRVWPFYCLHIGTLNIQESHYENLKAMVDGLQMVPVQNAYLCGPKLRILDLRQDLDCATTCTSRTTHPFCFQSCVYSQNSILKVEEAQHNVRCLGIVNSEHQPQLAWKPLEILVDLSFNGSLREKQFLYFLRSKVEQSFGSLHLCCRNLQIDKMSACKSSLQFLDLMCIDHLEVDQIYLSEVITLLTPMIHLGSFSLSNMCLRSCKGKTFRAFLTCLRRLENLQELSFSFFCLTDQLHRLLRVLPPQLDTLYLSFCNLSKKDITALSQSSQATHLKHLNLSNNQIFLDVYEPFQSLLEKASGSLQHLEINNCLMTDSAFSAILPALSHCSHLRVFTFAFNPITMPALMNLLQHLAALKELKHVIYPIPVHCYEQWNFHDSLDLQKLAQVQAQLKVMLHAVEREDMNWTSFLE